MDSKFERVQASRRRKTFNSLEEQNPKLERWDNRKNYRKATSKRPKYTTRQDSLPEDSSYEEGKGDWMLTRRKHLSAHTSNAKRHKTIDIYTTIIFLISIFIYPYILRYPFLIF